jgi:hypothetical protein
MRLPMLLTLWLTVTATSVVWAGQPDAARLAATRVAPLVQRGADPAALCETAVAAAEWAARLPARMLQAISLTESGRIDPASARIRAWPWTINAEGQGQFFPTRGDAVAAVRRLQARGVRSIDVGCLQVNLMYHPAAFASLDEAFDPDANARYAAGFLNALCREGKDWAHAIAAYHSETPALGDPYRTLVMEHWRNGDLRGPPRTQAFGGSAYRDFGRDDRIYGAFAPGSRVYGAFAPRQENAGSPVPPGIVSLGASAQARHWLPLVPEPRQARASITTPAHISPIAPSCIAPSGSANP